MTGTLDATDAENDALNFVLNGTVPAGLVLATNGNYTFDPTDAAYNGLAAGDTQEVTAGYTVTDDSGATDNGTITITVTGTNDAPVASDLTVAGVEDTVASGLAVATDVDGDSLSYSLATGPSDGGVTVNQNGSFQYTPDANFNGTDSFTYTVDDGNGGTDTATVTVNVAASTDELKSGVDNFQGSVADDIVTGNENTLNSGDTIVGGDGDDTLIINVQLGNEEDRTFSAFEADVETFRTTIDRDGTSGSATFDMSGSEIIGNTFVNINSTADVVYDRVNMNPQDPANSRWQPARLRRPQRHGQRGCGIHHPSGAGAWRRRSGQHPAHEP